MTDGANIIIFSKAQSTESILLKYSEKMKIQLKQCILANAYWLTALSLQPVPEELQNGEGFGYIIMFRPLGSTTWTKAAVAPIEASKYVYRNESITPLSPFEVKVGVYNNEGEGTLSSISIVYAGEDGKVCSSY